MAERSLDALLPEVREIAEKWLSILASQGVEMLVYCTYRSPEEQEALFQIGRTRPGKKITNARGWWSWHNYRRAWDAVPILFNKPLWRINETSIPLYKKAGSVAKSLGISWGGQWKGIKDFLHYEVTGGMMLADAYLLYGPGNKNDEKQEDLVKCG